MKKDFTIPKKHRGRCKKSPIPHPAYPFGYCIKCGKPFQLIKA